MEKLVDSGSWLSLQGMPLISRACRRHPPLLGKEGRPLIPGLGGGVPDCLPRAATLTPAWPRWEGGNPIHFAGSGILNLHGQSQQLRPHPRA
ncbi:hypothetical protein DBR06_SOUSAS2310049 [Sousa chinensis]|nr:hypothetical protein DBR06_SOUSAS2310049 [Sousa chinensis]